MATLNLLLRFTNPLPFFQSQSKNDKVIILPRSRTLLVDRFPIIVSAAFSPLHFQKEDLELDIFSNVGTIISLRIVVTAAFPSCHSRPFGNTRFRLTHLRRTLRILRINAGYPLASTTL